MSICLSLRTLTNYPPEQSFTNSLRASNLVIDWTAGLLALRTFHIAIDFTLLYLQSTATNLSCLPCILPAYLLELLGRILPPAGLGWHFDQSYYLCLFAFTCIML